MLEAEITEEYTAILYEYTLIYNPNDNNIR